MKGASVPPFRREIVPLLRLRVFLTELFRLNELQVTLFWAGVIGFLGAVSSVAFRRLTDLVHWLLTHQHGGLVESFAHLPPWQRVFTPAIGGLIAGGIMYLGMRLSRKKVSTDYMEAIVLGDGVVPARLSLVKCTSALFTVASGGSIGREGPLVQLSAMLASVVGRARRAPTVQLRLLVACGAAAGIASAYNAPIGGAMFVSEIVLGSMAMETFGPLVFASVVATLTVRQFLGGNPLYEIPVIRLETSWEILPHLLLGLLAGLAAPLFLRLLRASERGFAFLHLPAYARMALGGLIVGCLAYWHPEVCGNGYSTVTQILHSDWLWQTLLVVFVFKLVATAATFGSGAVGGVFTPTLFAGACLGYVFGHGTAALWPGPIAPAAFTLVGMGAFLAATTHAPIMAIVMLFEMTLDYEIIMPLMLACVVAHYTCRAFEPQSIYNESLKRKGAGLFRAELAAMHVADLMKKDPLSVPETADFAQIAETFITHRFNYLYVVNTDGAFRGAVSLHDIKRYLNQPDLAELVIARDVVQVAFPTVHPEQSLSDALSRFTEKGSERLPVLDNDENRRLIGSISKSDILLALAEQG